MFITFIVNDIKHVFDIDDNDKIINIKRMLKDKFFNTSDDWLMLSYMGDKPIREYGKQDLIPGDIPLSMDRKSLNDFSIRDDVEYVFKVYEIKDTSSIKSNKIHRNTVIKPVTFQKSEYNLDSISDFPTIS